VTSSRRPRKAEIDPRVAAVDTLLAVDSGAHSGALLAALPGAMQARDRALATEIVYGVLRRRAILDRALAGIASRAPERIDPPLLAVLRVALYQILFLDRVPPPAAVDEAVGLARRRSGRSGAAFVNGALRGFLRSGRPRAEDITGARPDGRDRAGALRDWLACDTSFPRAFVDRVLEEARSLPGVTSAAAVHALPTTHHSGAISTSVIATTILSAPARASSVWMASSPGTFAVVTTRAVESGARRSEGSWAISAA